MPTPIDGSTPSRPIPSLRWTVGIVIAALLIPAAVVFVLQVNAGPQFSDQWEYHLRTIEQFVRQWPAFDFKAYPAAMTPGYHLLMASLVKFGASVVILRLATLGIAIVFMSILAGVVGKRLSVVDAVLLCLPVTWSQYIFGSSVTVAPHNLAWLGVLAVLLLCRHFRSTWQNYLAFAVTLVLLILSRQIHLWAVAPMVVAAAWPKSETASEDRPSLDGASTSRSKSSLVTTSLRRVGAVLLASIPALLILSYFVYLWDGLAPSTQIWARPVHGVNGAAIAMMLATFGAVGIWYAGWWLGDSSRAVWKWSLLGGVIGLCISAIPQTSYDMSAGRWSGLWNLARLAPTVADRSPVVLGLAAVGGFVIAGFLAAQRPKERAIFAATLAGFVAAHAGISQAWGRYYEPLMLLVMVLGCGELEVRSSTDGGTNRWLTRAPLAVFALIQLCLTALSLR